MANDKLTRRDFVYESAVAAAGLALGLPATKTVYAGNPNAEDTSKIPSYSPEIEPRRAPVFQRPFGLGVASVGACPMC